MFFFEGSKCPVCGEELRGGDDVVACPVCGTPHHRECYKSSGGCAFEARHEEGYVWQREKKSEPAAEETKKCPSCRADNAADRLWCENCGAPLGENPVRQRSELNSGDTPEPNSTYGKSWESPNGYYSIGSEVTIADNELIDDVPAGDLKRFVKGTSYYYIPLFAAFSRFGKKVSLNMMAFIMHGLWFLSRKMYLLGGIVLAVQVAINAFQNYCYVQLEDLMELYSDGKTSEAYAMVAELMVERPVMMFGMVFSTILRYVILFGSGLLANWLYKEHCVRKVKKLNARAKNAEEFNNLLEQKGGMALPLAVGCSVLYIAIRMFLQSVIVG